MFNVTGLGAGLPLVAKVVALKDYFQHRFSLANGIAFTGGAIGFATLSPLLGHFIDKYGWRGAALIYAAMHLNVCVAGFLMVGPYDGSKLLRQGTSSQNIEKTSIKLDNIELNISVEPTGLKTQTDKRKSTCWKRVIDYFGFSVLHHYPVLTIYLIAMSMHEFVAGGWVLFLVPYSVSLGYPAQTASFLTTLGGLGALIGRLVVGPFVDKGLISGRMMFCILASCGAVVLCLYPFTNEYWILSSVSFLTGLFLASTTPIFIVILKDILQEDGSGFAGAVGLHYMARGFGTLLGGPITGKSVVN